MISKGGSRHKFTTEIYKEKIANKYPNIECIGIYINNNTAIKHLCKIHGMFYKAPMKLLNRNSGCPKCGLIKGGINRRKTEESILKRIFDKHGDTVKLCEKFTLVRSPHKFICDKNHTWVVSVDSVLGGSGCKICGFVKTGLALVKSHDKAIQDLFKCHKDKVKLNEVYKTVTSIHEFICDKGHTWKAHFGGVLYHRSKCPECSVFKGFSLIERKWLDLIQHKVNKNMISSEHEKFRIKLPRYKNGIIPDGYDPKTKTVYEFYGDYWHGNLGTKQQYNIGKFTKIELNKRTRKREKALLKAGYKVVYVWESDFKRYLEGKFHFRPKPFKKAKLTKSIYCY